MERCSSQVRLVASHLLMVQYPLLEKTEIVCGGLCEVVWTEEEVLSTAISKMR